MGQRNEACRRQTLVPVGHEKFLYGGEATIRTLRSERGSPEFQIKGVLSMSSPTQRQVPAEFAERPARAGAGKSGRHEAHLCPSESFLLKSLSSQLSNGGIGRMLAKQLTQRLAPRILNVVVM